MTEPQPGLLVSNLSGRAWEPGPDVGGPGPNLANR